MPDPTIEPGAAPAPFNLATAPPDALNLAQMGGAGTLDVNGGSLTAAAMDRAAVPSPVTDPTKAASEGQIPNKNNDDAAARKAEIDAEVERRLAEEKAKLEAEAGKKLFETPKSRDKDLEASDIVTGSVSEAEWVKRGGIGMEADQQFFTFVRNLRRDLEELRHSDPSNPNIRRIHEMLLRVCTDDFIKQGEALVQAREAKLAKYKTSEEKAKHRFETDDKERIIKTRDQLMTFITVADQHQLILGEAWGAMVSNNGTRPVEFALPPVEDIEVMLKKGNPGVPEAIWNGIRDRAGNLTGRRLFEKISEDTALVAGVLLAKQMLDQGRPGAAALTGGAVLLAEIATHRTPILQNRFVERFFYGTDGEVQGLRVDFQPTEGRVVRTYLDSFNRRGLSADDIANELADIQEWKANIFARAGLDLQDGAEAAMMRLDRTVLDPTASTQSRGEGRILLYNRRQEQITALLGSDPKYEGMSPGDLSTDDFIELVMKGSENALTNMMDGLAGSVLEENARNEITVKREDMPGRVTSIIAEAQKYRSGLHGLDEVTNEMIEIAGKASQNATDNFTQLTTDINRIKDILRKELEPARDKAQESEEAFDRVLDGLKLTRSPNTYTAREIELSGKIKPDQTRLEEITAKLTQLRKETKSRDKNDGYRTGAQIQADIDRLEGEESVIRQRVSPLQAEYTALTDAKNSWLANSGALKTLSNELARLKKSALSSLVPNKQESIPDINDYFSSEEIRVNKLKTEYANLQKRKNGEKGIQLTPTEADKATAVVLEYVALLGTAGKVTIGGAERQGRFGIILGRIINGDVDLGELASRGGMGYEKAIDLLVGTISTGDRAKLKAAVTKADLGQHIVKYFGIADKNPNGRAANLYKNVPKERVLLRENETAKAELVKAGKTAYTTPNTGPLTSKSYEQALEYYDSQMASYAADFDKAGGELLDEVIGVLGVNRMDTAEFFQDFALTLFDKAYQGVPAGELLSAVPRAETRSAVDVEGVTVNSQYGRVTLQESPKNEGVSTGFGEIHYSTPSGFRADPNKPIATPMEVALKVNYPESVGSKPDRMTLTYQLKFTPEWWKVMPDTKGGAKDIFPKELVNLVYGENTPDAQNKRTQEEIGQEMNTPLSMEVDVADMNQLGNNIDSMTGFGGVVNEAGTNWSGISNRFVKSVGEAIIHGEARDVAKYMVNFVPLELQVVGNSTEKFEVSWTKDGLVVRDVTNSSKTSIGDFVDRFEENYRRVNNIPPGVLTDVQFKEMHDQIEYNKLLIGISALQAIQR